MAERPGEMDERDVDERFASIVARWEGAVPDPDATTSSSADADDPSGSEGSGDPAAGRATTDPPAPARPHPSTGPAALPGAPAPPPSSPDDPDATGPVARSPWVNPSPLERVVPQAAWRSATPPDEETQAAAAAAEADLEDEHFEPPEVTLPPQEDLHFWGAVIGLVAGPLMLLYVVFARPFHSTRWFVASVIVSLLGFALLVLRQPRTRDELEGDDGARI